jgi:hypothetical protein
MPSLDRLQFVERRHDYPSVTFSRWNTSAM